MFFLFVFRTVHALVIFDPNNVPLSIIGLSKELFTFGSLTRKVRFVDVVNIDKLAKLSL